MYVGYSTNYYPYFHYILILRAHCIIPIHLLSLPILTGNRTSHHACLKRLASRRHMQTQLDTKSSLIASRLPALVVTVCFLFVWIRGVLWDFSFFEMRSRSVQVQLLHISSFLSVCLPPTGSPRLFLFLTIFLYLSHLYLSTYRKGGYPSSSFPPPFCLCLCLCFRTDN